MSKKTRLTMKNGRIAKRLSRSARRALIAQSSESQIINRRTDPTHAYTSTFITRVKDRHGAKKAIDFSQPVGGKLSASPAMAAAWWLRKKLRPIHRAPVKILDATGRHIATVTIDPVTGARTRTEEPR